MPPAWPACAPAAARAGVILGRHLSFTQHILTSIQHYCETTVLVQFAIKEGKTAERTEKKWLCLTSPNWLTLVLNMH